MCGSKGRAQRHARSVRSRRVDADGPEHWSQKRVLPKQRRAVGRLVSAVEHARSPRRASPGRLNSAVRIRYGYRIHLFAACSSVRVQGQGEFMRHDDGDLRWKTILMHRRASAGWIRMARRARPGDREHAGENHHGRSARNEPPDRLAAYVLDADLRVDHERREASERRADREWQERAGKIPISSRLGCAPSAWREPHRSSGCGCAADAWLSAR